MTTPHQTAGQAFGTAVGGQWGDVASFVGQGAYQVGSAAQNWGQDVTQAFVKALINGPAAALGTAFTSVEHFLEELGTWLATLPLEALQMFQAFIPGSVLADFATVASAVSTIVNALGLNNVLMYLGDFEAWLAATFSIVEANAQAAINAIEAMIAGIAGTTIADVVALLQKIQQIIDALVNLVSGGAGSGATVSTLISRLQSALQGILPAAFGNGDGTGSAVTGAGITINADGTAFYDDAVDSVHSLVSIADGTAMSVGDSLKNFANSGQKFVTDNWNGLLANTGLPTGQHVASAVAGLIPAALDQADGTAAVVGNEIVHNLDGTATYAQNTLTNSVNALIDNADGTAMSAAHTIQNAIEAASQSSVQNLTQAVHTGQAVIDAGVNAFTNTVGSTLNQVEHFGSAISGFFTGLANVWGGTSLPSAGPTEVQDAAQASRDAASQQSQLATAIQNQISTKYGGGGDGLSFQQVFSGTLPDTFTTVSTIAASSAKYNTPAVTDTQTASGIWTVTDGQAKYLFIRGNSSFTTYAYVKLQDNNPSTHDGNCEIGCVVGGVKTVFATFALPGAGTVVSNGTYYFSGVSNVFTAIGPNGLEQVYTDHTVPTMTSYIGDSYRYGGFGTDGWAREIYDNTSPGAFSYPVPAWADHLDAVVCTGGGGGAPNQGYTSGGVGGHQGQWLGYSITKAQAGNTISGVVSAGGGSGANATTAQIQADNWTGYNILGGFAGVGGWGSQYGAGGGTCASIVFNNRFYQGGGGGGGGQGNGGYPGGGGGGGNSLFIGSYIYGGHGGNGRQIIVAYDISLPGSLASWSFIDSAVVGPTTAYVATSESTTSTSYTDLATTSDFVTVNIGSSGSAIVFISATNAYVSGTNPTYYAGFALSGANTQAASDAYAAADSNTGNNSGAIGAPFLLTGLTSGATTFKMKYRVNTGSVSFANRRISVIPL